VCTDPKLNEHKCVQCVTREHETYLYRPS
jgi:hypothetical protein